MSPPAAPLSDFPGRAVQDRLLHRARIFLGLTVLLGGGLALGALSYVRGEVTGDGMGLREWMLDLPAALLCAGLVALLLYSRSRGLRRDATTRLWLNGTTLIITHSKGSDEVDLAAAVCDVELVGSTRNPYAPHLRLHRDGPDGLPIDLELSESFTKTLRPPGELLALANVMRNSPHQRTRDAAGRLRTIAGWTSMPVIYAADRDAIPITPDPAGQWPGTPQPVLPTPVRLADPSPEVALPAKPPINPVRRTLVDLSLMVIASVLVLTALTVASATHPMDAFESGDRDGQATVTACTRKGPVSIAGFGYWYTCTADVLWADGERETETFGSSVMTEADIGQAVPVHEVSGGRSSTDRTFRADASPNGWGLLLILPLFLIALMCLLQPVVDVGRIVIRPFRGNRRS